MRAQEWKGHKDFVVIFVSDLQGSPLWSVFLEPGRAVKSMSGDVGRHYPQAKLFNESPRMLNDLLHEGCR